MQIKKHTFVKLALNAVKTANGERCAFVWQSPAGSQRIYKVGLGAKNGEHREVFVGSSDRTDGFRGTGWSWVSPPASNRNRPCCATSTSRILPGLSPKAELMGRPSRLGGIGNKDDDRFVAIHLAIAHVRSDMGVSGEMSHWPSKYQGMICRRTTGLDAVGQKPEEEWSTEIYLKPRPISSILGHSNYLPFQWHPDFKYGPFFNAGYGTIPSDATEVYTIHSPDLSAGIAAFHNELIPSLQDESPDPDKASRSLWPNIYEFVIAKLKPVTQFLRDSKDRVNRLYHSPLLQVEGGPECGPANVEGREEGTYVGKKLKIAWESSSTQIAHVRSDSEMMEDSSTERPFSRWQIWVPVMMTDPMLGILDVVGFVASDNPPPVYEESSPHPFFAHGNLNGVAPHELVVPDNGVAVFEEYCRDKGDLVAKELHELSFAVTEARVAGGWGWVLPSGSERPE
ncbi:hypothetical protein EDD85DRAFT_789896 [Armillaria nabsnona]|nr:hypothetical protein EDD85DRAFT_789896 [Armillaria nabsnona]